MLVEFSVGNFMSFYEKKTFSFMAEKSKELKENVFNFNGDNLLKSAVIYGANSSGKTNLIKAMMTMKHNINNSVKLNFNDTLEYQPFRLLQNSTKEPTFFEIIFWSNNTKYRYGFEYHRTKISKEWLFEWHSTFEKPLFLRTEEGIGVSEDFQEGENKESQTNENRLFLSLVAQLGGKIAQDILTWFEKHFNIIFASFNEGYQIYSINMFLNESEGYQQALDFFQSAKLGFKNITVEENPTINDKEKTYSFHTSHNVYNLEGKVLAEKYFNTFQYESEGTKKIIDLSSPFFDTLYFGKVLIVDELDAKLHPLISQQLIQLFNNKKSNPNNAQLLFATHDTNLLSVELFRTDQIWFTEKDAKEQTDLYSLYTFNLPNGNKVSSKDELEKNYIRGRFGAIPYISN